MLRCFGVMNQTCLFFLILCLSLAGLLSVQAVYQKLLASQSHRSTLGAPLQWLEGVECLAQGHLEGVWRGKGERYSFTPPTQIFRAVLGIQTANFLVICLLLFPLKLFKLWQIKRKIGEIVGKQGNKGKRTFYLLRCFEGTNQHWQVHGIVCSFPIFVLYSVLSLFHWQGCLWI